jgi:DNA/RNA endonuclease YhcR with UshA esterase domain
MKIVLGLFLMTTLPLVLADVFAGEPTTPIRTVRAGTLGTEVTVSGIVTVAPGTQSSSSGDQGFAIQDQTAGIYVSLQSRINLRLGQKVAVTGVLAKSNEKLQVVPVSSTAVRLLHEPSLVLKTGELGESTAGYVIAIEGTVTEQGLIADDPYGAYFFLDDGSGPGQVYLNASTNINSDGALFKAGTKLQVTGFCNQFGSTFEIDPRSKIDILVVH